MSEFPETLARIAEAAGPEAARRIAEARGGTMVEIPRRLRGNNWLTDLVGPEAAAAIVQALGHGRLYVPAGDARCAGGRRAEAARLIEAGLSERETALATGLSQPTVRRIRRRLRETPALPLLDGDGGARSPDPRSRPPRPPVG